MILLINFYSSENAPNKDSNNEHFELHVVNSGGVSSLIT